MPTIYKLINPLTNEVYYIGYTERKIEERLKDHLRTPKHETTKTLIKGCYSPIIEQVETGEHITKSDELRIIKQYHKDGHKLENISGIDGFNKGLNNDDIKYLSTLPKEEQYKIALNKILKELPLNATYPIVLRIKDIAETVLSL